MYFITRPPNRDH